MSAGALALPRRREDLVRDVERVTLRRGRDGGISWFHPRACRLPDGAILMTLQSITGSDLFGPVHWTESRDLGRSWTDPQPIPALGRRPAGEDLEEGVCDVVPEHHPRTRTILAMGHNVFYRKNAFFNPQPPRHSLYVVRGPDGAWSERRRLEWDDPRATQIYSCGCAQRATLESGDILVPLSFGPKERTDRSVATALCAFDGKTLAVKRVGNELRKPVGRGFLEPSLAALDGRFHLTIRAEDGRGYVTRSGDGLAWEEPVAWAWDDGEPLAMSTTQQRWLVHSEALHLVYTRKAKENANVMRWRAPLYMARVDRSTLRLVRATERVVLPLVGDGINDPKNVAHLGNFHTNPASPGESWVTVGEVIPASFRGDLLLARVRWSRPNPR